MDVGKIRWSAQRNLVVVMFITGVMGAVCVTAPKYRVTSGPWARTLLLK